MGVYTAGCRSSLRWGWPVWGAWEIIFFGGEPTQWRREALLRFSSLANAIIAPSPKPSLNILLSLFVLAVALRLLNLIFLSGSLDWEGVEYARLAQNLVAGNGYVGLNLPGVNLMFPPLYPLLIAALSTAVPKFDLAAQIISISLGAATVFPIFLLTRELYNGRAAVVAAAIIAVHPLLVQFPSTGGSEATFLFFVSFAMYFAVRGFHGAPWTYAIAAGAFFGLAYLTRIEGAPLVAVALVLSFGSIAWREVRAHAHGDDGPTAFRRAASYTCAMLIAFLIVAAPYILFLYDQTGEWRLEAKSPLNLETALRVVLEEEDVSKVHYEVDVNLNERGVWNRPYMDTIGDADFDLKEMLLYLFTRMTSWTSKWLIGAITGFGHGGAAFGTPAFFGFAVVGLLVALLTQHRISGQLLLMAAAAIYVAQNFLIVFHNIRFLISLVPIMSVWAGAGFLFIYSCLVEWSETVPWSLRFRQMAVVLLGVFLSALLIVAHFGAMKQDTIAAHSYKWRPIVEAARAIGQSYLGGSSKPILVGPTTLGFYAGLEHRPFPFADEQTALRYFDKHKVGYIAFSNRHDGRAPYLASWWSRGIPSSSAILLREVAAADGRAFRFYKWLAGKGSPKQSTGDGRKP